MDDEPVAVGLVFDISGSMGPKLQKSRQAAAEFFRTSNSDDEFFLVEFNDQPKLVVPLTRNVEEIQNQLTWAQSKGRTALLDAIFLAMNEMKKSKKNRKALLIISDGGDNSSRYSESEVRNLVRENDVLIYAIGVYEFGGGRMRTPEEAGGPGLLTELSEQTGGRHLPADASELPDIAAKIGVELRNRYVLGYTPKNQVRDGRYHTLQVKVVPPRDSVCPRYARSSVTATTRRRNRRGRGGAFRLELSFDPVSIWVEVDGNATNPANSQLRHPSRDFQLEGSVSMRRDERRTPCLRRQYFPTAKPKTGLTAMGFTGRRYGSLRTADHFAAGPPRVTWLMPIAPPGRPAPPTPAGADLPHRMQRVIPAQLRPNGIFAPVRIPPIAATIIDVEMPAVASGPYVPGASPQWQRRCGNCLRHHRSRQPDDSGDQAAGTGETRPFARSCRACRAAAHHLSANGDSGPPRRPSILRSLSRRAFRSRRTARCAGNGRADSRIESSARPSAIGQRRDRSGAAVDLRTDSAQRAGRGSLRADHGELHFESVTERKPLTFSHSSCGKLLSR